MNQRDAHDDVGDEVERVRSRSSALPPWMLMKAACLSAARGAVIGDVAHDAYVLRNASRMPCSRRTFSTNTSGRRAVLCHGLVVITQMAPVSAASRTRGTSTIE